MLITNSSIISMSIKESLEPKGIIDQESWECDINDQYNLDIILSINGWVLIVMINCKYEIII